MECVTCEQNSKYKCPVCRQPYCSVACYKTHKEEPCEAPVPSSVEKKEEVPSSLEAYDFPTEDTVPVEKLELLSESMDLKKLLDNPHLREILETLDKSQNPDGMIKKYMQEPIFTEFVDECLKVVEPGNNEDS